MPTFNSAFNYNILPPWQVAVFYLSKLSGKCLLLFCLEIQFISLRVVPLTFNLTTWTLTGIEEEDYLSDVISTDLHLHQGQFPASSFLGLPLRHSC